MSMRRQGGYINALLLGLIVSLVALVGLASFGGWAFMSRQDYKNKSDQKSAVAVAAARKDQQSKDRAAFAEEAKNPLKQFTGPSQYGSVTAQYPKTWSGYVITNSSTPLSAYFQADVVPDINNADNAYALHIEVIARSYAAQLQQYESQVQTKSVTVSPYSLPKVPSVVGSRIDGQIAPNTQGSVILLPLRNMTLQITTESQSFENDLNTIILPNLSFAP